MQCNKSFLYRIQYEMRLKKGFKVYILKNINKISRTDEILSREGYIYLSYEQTTGGSGSHRSSGHSGLGSQGSGFLNLKNYKL